MALPDFNTALDLLKKGATLEAQEEITSLREVHVSLREENIKLREENLRLDSKLNSHKTLKYEDPYYWNIEGDVKDGPFCQLCHDKHEKQIRLQTGGIKGYWKCYNCKTDYYDKNYIEPNYNSTAVVDYHPFKY